MKKRLRLVLPFLFIVVAFISFMNGAKPKFYYAFKEKKTLTDHKSKLVIRFKAASSRAAFQSAVKGTDTSQSQKWSDKRTLFYTCSNEGKQQDLLSRFTNDTNVVSVHPVELIDQGVEAGITDEFVAQFNDNISKATIDSLNKVYGVKIISSSFYYLLQVRPKADALSIANIYQETGLVKFSHPNFISAPTLYQHIPNDPYFPSQFNFNNTGQVINDGHTGTPGADIKAPLAWDITRGSNAITIAVLDEGVTSNHPDLPNTRQIRLAGSNFGDGAPNDPSPAGTHDHGNSCAGLIGATQDNNEGISGLAPNCNIMPIRIFNSDGSGIAIGSVANAITLAYTNGAAVLSNSWGYNSSDPNLYPVIVTAIQNATTLGRNGLGCVVVFAAGNFATQPGYVTFPACARVTNLMAVGASDRYDQQAAYSPTGVPSVSDHTVVDLVAPSHRAYPNQIAGETFEVWSLDIPGLGLGYNSWPEAGDAHPPATGETLPSAGPNFDAYTGRFGGTSAACPQVAGLAALILSVNPGMTATGVCTQMMYNADKVGGYDYSNGGRSTQTGNGRINACASVVTSIPITGPSNFCTSATYTLPNLPAGASVTWTGSGSSGSVTMTPSGNSVTLTKVTDGDIYFGATISNTCKSGSFTVGTHVVAGTPIPAIGIQPATNCYYDVVASVPTGSTAIQYSTNGSSWGNAAIQYTPNIGYQAFIARSVEGPATLYYYVRSVNACGTGPSSARRSITIPKPRTGCALVVADTYSITMYPNPSSGLVTVSVPSAEPLKSMEAQVPAAINLINVYSVDGRLLRHFEYSTSVRQATIDLSALPSGNYLIEIGDKSVRKTQNLMLKH